jgi:hypothetical protein
MIRTSIAALVAVSLFAFGASAQPGPGRPGPAKNYICPQQVVVKMVAANPMVLGVVGWKANEGPFTVTLDPANPPMLSGGNMVCYYKVGSQQAGFDLFQPVGMQKCSPLSNKTGFVCTQ